MTDINTLLAERGKTHGKYEDHARVTQQLKEIMHAGVKWNALNNSEKEALEMIAHKIGRILSGNPHFKDHWDDIAGYSTLVANDVDRALAEL
jgi:hypothetical protein